MRSLTIKIIAIAAVSALSFGTADAAMISNTYAVIGSNFVSTTASPFASITESFTISFNNAVTVSQQTAGISLNASTITPSSTLAFTYVAGVDTLIVGGVAATVTTSDPNSTDFALVINNASSTNFGITSLTYSTGQGAVFTALTTGIAPAAVPEPASLALLGVAAVGAGALRRRQGVSGKKKIVNGQ